MTVGEVHQMANAEYIGWCAYYGMKAQVAELAQKKAARKSKGR